jgi:O-antigen chain-terminating methyltransferase
MNVSSTELNVDHLMTAIRDAVSKKHPDYDIEAKHEPIPYRVPQHVEQKKERNPLTLSPEFRFHNNGAYHINDLLKYHDRDFVRNAYRAILKREPDEAGFLHNLGLLQSGVFNKIDILASLRYSNEGKASGVTISGLRFPATIRTVERIPFIGYVFQLLLAFVRLPLMIRSQRQFQGYLVAQQLAIADYVNDLHRANEEMKVENTNQITERTTLINQVHAVEVTLKETVLPRILTDDAEAQLVQLDDRLSQLSQIVSRTRQQISALASDIRTLERNAAAEKIQTNDELREWDNFYAAFEDQFRGSAEEVEERLKYYLPFLQELNADSKILDLGSGRGDWLKLLNKQGFKPCAVEVNAVFAERLRAEGFEVTHSDMMVYLRRQPDDSLDLITAFHLIEHMSTDKLITLLNEIKRTLKPGGRVFIETPSPENLVVAACNFYADPTHHTPVNPHTLMFILRSMGFVDLGLQFLHPIDDSPFKECEGAQQLNMWFYGPRDFSAIARKAQ